MTPTPDDNELRARIYREAMLDAENENKRLREENERLSDRSAMWYNEAANHAEKVAELRPQLADAERRMKRYQEEILTLEANYEELEQRINAVRVTLADAVARLKFD